MLFRKAPAAPKDLPKITLAELRRHDGDRLPAYIAFRGQVYDISESGEWRGGLHRNLHWAGQDLTDELVDAPHGEENLYDFPIVGILVTDEA